MHMLWKLRRRKPTSGWLLPVLAGLIFIVGVGWRANFILHTHPMQAYIYSDMQTYDHEMINFYQPGYHLGPSDFFYPPGTPLIFGFFYNHFGHSWFVLGLLQLFFSAMIPVLIGAIGWLLYGRRVGLIALIIASLYVAFVEYSGFLLSETPFEFFFYAGLLALVWATKRKTPQQRWLTGLGAGLLFGVACSVRSNGLIPIIGLILLLLIYGWRGRRWLLPLAIASLGGLLMIVVPVSARCSASSDHFCVLSTNGMLGILQGHYGNVGHFQFNDAKAGTYYTYGNPTTLQKGHQDFATFQFAPYDSGAVTSAALNWIKANPWWAFKLSVSHVGDLFYGSVPWPPANTSGRHRIIISEWLFRVFILLPAVIYCAALAFGPKAKKVKGRSSDLMMIVPIIGLMLVVFVTVAEPRYRIVFDGLFIILAARAYTFGRTEDG